MTTCLVIDDVEVTRFTATEFLTEMGLDIVVADNGEEALKALRQKSVDVVLLDWHLGKKSGIDLLKEIRSEFGSKLPVVVFSGVTARASANEALDAGANSFLEKPTTREGLERCFRELRLPLG